VNVWHDFSFLLTEGWRPEGGNERVKDRESETLQVFHWLLDEKKRVGRHSVCELYYITHFGYNTGLDEWIFILEFRSWSFSYSTRIYFLKKFSFLGFAFLAVRRVAWRLHCQGDTDSYTADCNTSSSSSSPSAANDSSGADRERKPQLAAQPENPQQSNSNWLWSPFSHAFPTGWLFFWAHRTEKK
jgi:hypothetical protein